MSSKTNIKAVAVKTLVSFAAKTGSIDRRFTPSPSGQEGIEGHKTVTSRRHKDYQSEYTLELDYEGLLLRGRADGYDPVNHVLEEIKTHYGDWTLIPQNHQQLHWAQLKFYGWMYCVIHQRDAIGLNLIYLNLLGDKEMPIKRQYDFHELEEFAIHIIGRYQEWHACINKRLTELSYWIESLAFPFENMHPSQRQMAELVYKAAALNRTAMVEAPTGTGKTLAALFPALKSLRYTDIDKIFYLTTKSTTKNIALDAIQLIASDSNTPLRSLELTAQEKICLEPDKECHGESCPYALDFYNKLWEARKAAATVPVLDQAKLIELAKIFTICPFYLGMEMARWTDVVIADINYFVDGTPLLLALTEEFNWQTLLLLDEAHNLIDRGRDIYSAKISRKKLLTAKKFAPKSLQYRLTQMNKRWLELIDLYNAEDASYKVIHEIPAGLLQTAIDFTHRMTEFLQEKSPEQAIPAVLMDFFFDVFHFQRIAEILDDDFCIELIQQDEKLSLRNLVPAKQLSLRFNYAKAACFFSATLTPTDYYQQLLGLPDDTVIQQLQSPFSPNQLQIKIAHTISTRYQHREASIKPLCHLIMEQIQSCPGNAMLFTSSYEYLQVMETELRHLAISGTQLLVQSKQMTEIDRENFINEFHEKNNLLGLAVLGGVFSEGIDLPGEKLKGVFIATLGLPQINPMNEQLARCLQEKFQRGQDYTYLYPGIQKVVQAAGRVIRTTEDKGYLYLLDERFQQRKVRSLLPGWWNIENKRDENKRYTSNRTCCS